jgi:hypothetical protein
MVIGSDPKILVKSSIAGTTTIQAASSVVAAGR